MKNIKIKFIVIVFGIFISSLVFANKLNWTENFTQAKELAQKEHKVILADFTGSDWCPWCIKLDKEVFNTPEFENYAKNNLILFKADFPQNKHIDIKTKDQNIRLMDHYQVYGFPTVLLLNDKGDIIFHTGYQEGGPKLYIEQLQKAIKENDGTKNGQK